MAEAAAVVLVRLEVQAIVPGHQSRSEAEAAAVVLVRPEVQESVPGHQPRRRLRWLRRLRWFWSVGGAGDCAWPSVTLGG